MRVKRAVIRLVRARVITMWYSKPVLINLDASGVSRTRRIEEPRAEATIDARESRYVGFLLFDYGC